MLIYCYPITVPHHAGRWSLCKMLNPSIGPFLHLNLKACWKKGQDRKRKKKEGMNTMTHIDLVVRIYCIPFFPTWQTMVFYRRGLIMWMMPAHSVSISEQPDYCPFCWFLNPIPHPVLFSPFSVLTHWGSLGFRSEKLQICSIRSSLFWGLYLQNYLKCCSGPPYRLLSV